MREKLSTKEGREIYAKRTHKVETVFWIIKAPLGLRQFLLRGAEKVRVVVQIAVDKGGKQTESL